MAEGNRFKTKLIERQKEQEVAKFIQITENVDKMSV